MSLSQCAPPFLSLSSLSSRSPVVRSRNSVETPNKSTETESKVGGVMCDGRSSRRRRRIKNEVTLRRLKKCFFVCVCVSLHIHMCVCVAWAPGVVLYIRFVTAKRSEEKTIEWNENRKENRFVCFFFWFFLFLCQLLFQRNESKIPLFIV